MASFTKRLLVHCTGRGVLMFVLVVMAILTYTFVRLFMSTPVPSSRSTSLGNYRTTNREGEMKRLQDSKEKIDTQKSIKVALKDKTTVPAVETTTQTPRQKKPVEPPKAVKPPPEVELPEEEKPVEPPKEDKPVEPPKQEKMEPPREEKVEPPEEGKVEPPKEEIPVKLSKEEKPVEPSKDDRKVESNKEEKPVDIVKEDKSVEVPKEPVETSKETKVEKQAETPKDNKPPETPNKDLENEPPTKVDSKKEEKVLESTQKESVNEPKDDKQSVSPSSEKLPKQEQQIEPQSRKQKPETAYPDVNQQIELDRYGDISLNANDAQNIVRKLQKTGNTLLDLFLDDQPKKSNDLSSWVHLDLKGAAPSVEYLIQLVPLLKQWGATGLLIEYEDMFPWRNEIAILKATNAYTISSLKRFLTVVKESDLEAVPVLQTLGHLEFLLKHASFQHLRENVKYPAFLNPSKDESIMLLRTMIDQVMDMHTGSKYIHIGCDEVSIMGTSKESQENMQKNGYNVAQLYLRHIQSIANYTKATHNVQTLIWDDMMRYMQTEELKAANMGSYVEPVIWDYEKMIKDRITDDIWDKYAAVFANVWVASAFKGASGSVQHLPELSIHLQNHANWLKVIDELKTSHPSIKVNGFVLTGWSRYDHFSALCDLLPASIPSLVACLQIIKTGTWNAGVIQDVSSLLKCTGPVFALNPDNLHFGYAFEIPSMQEVMQMNTPKQCSFPGDDIFNIILLYHQALQTFEKYFDPITGESRGHCNRFSLGHNFVNPFGVESMCSTAAEKVINVFKVVDERVPVIFRTIYDDSVANEWLEEHVFAFESWLQQYKSSVQSAAPKSPVWGERPGEFLDKKKDDAAMPSMGG